MPTSVEYFEATVRLSNILKGECHNDIQRRIYKRFWAVYSQEIFRRMHASYHRRAKKNPDDYPDWEPLKPKTIRRKRNRRKPPPSSHPTWINYDSGKLLKSYRPGNISGDSYLPSGNQLWSLKPGKLILGTLVKYAERVSARRDLFPRAKVLMRWSKEATGIAIKAILPLLGNGGKVWPDSYPGFWPFRNTKGQFSRIG